MWLNKKLYNKLQTVEQLKSTLTIVNFRGQKIVFTNGVFDILHTGHVDYLSKARDLGHFLVLGLNTDASVKRLNKGPERPINNEKARATVLGALECVDAIVLFDEETPYELIKAIQPDILVKGSDYAIENIVGYDVVKAKGGEVITIDLSQGFSTTNIIKKISEGK
ncbi:MAG: D-glycero-beta-D-manno-heptose 1-phosphate adenylyltransferase [Bacteroidetes bacterium]|jgi:rfaE bifunctional protein nucleotidyltransferase chain/domain|nr:D-glycero-beta-D-manno-heptose 1-phosphate adenylyltransferase [Bacteroidota bacterium]